MIANLSLDKQSLEVLYLLMTEMRIVMRSLTLERSDYSFVKICFELDDKFSACTWEF